MGDNANAMVQSVIGSISVDSIMAPINGLVNMIPGDIINIFETYKIYCTLAAVCLLVLFAFEGYKLFKMLVYAGGAFTFALLGYMVIGPLVSENLGITIAENVDLNAIIAIACALIAIFLTRFAYEFMIMCLGGVSGYFLGSILIYSILVNYFNTLDFLKADYVKHIVGGIFAAVLGILFILIFKHVFMVGTSFLCLMEASLLIQSLLMPDADLNTRFCFILVGIAAGIFAVVHQYKEEEKAMEIVC